MQAAGTFEVVVEHADAPDPRLLVHAIQNLIDDLAEIIPIAPGSRGALVRQRALLRLRGLQHRDGVLVPAPFGEIRDGRLRLEDLV